MLIALENLTFGMQANRKTTLFKVNLGVGRGGDEVVGCYLQPAFQAKQNNYVVIICELYFPSTLQNLGKYIDLFGI